MKLKIMTYNIASGHDYTGSDSKNYMNEKPLNVDACASVIKAESPDICGLNEVDNLMTRSGKISMTDVIAEKCSMNGKFGKAVSFHFDPEGAYGNAMLSKYPVTLEKIYEIPEPVYYDESQYYETRSLSKFRVDVAGGITVFQIHFGLSIEERQNAVETVCRALDETKGPVILMGDFNTRPHEWILRPINERLTDAAILANGKYLKTFPSYMTTEGIEHTNSFAYPHYPDCKIDYIYVSKEFKLLDYKVPDAKASDHFPYYIIAEI